MDRETMGRLVASAPVGRLATVRTDGRPHVVPICFVITEDVVYSAVDDKPKRHGQLQRLSNVRATGTASLLIDEYYEDWSRLWWVRLDGRARVVESPSEIERAIRSLSDKYPQYRDQPPTGPVLALDVERWVGWSGSVSGSSA
ncbi:MAG TPA: TIGR03668 family PPOX class F420-dependent oxidoreductase [Propionibacteriaceae bacterium]|nr:TIGR03668 family PPOX class F420-dependent oxidoreductase [Propionibacteriaceae bacterium]